MLMTMDDVDSGYEGYPPDSDGDEVVPQRVYRKAKQAGVLQAHKPKTKSTTSMGRGGNSSTRILAQQKRRQALEFRKAGMTYQQIADQVGYKKAGSAANAVKKAFGEVIQEPVAELKAIQIERLNHMLLTLWGRVQGGDDQAIRTSLAIMDKIDALSGTEAAKQMEVRSQSTSAVLVIDGSEDDYTAALKRMAGMGIGADGKNITQAKQVGAAGNYPPGMSPKATPELAPAQHGDTLVAAGDDVVDAELVEDDSLAAHLGPDGMEAVKGIMAEPTPPASPTKKKYSFGVDPTVRKRDAS